MMLLSISDINSSIKLLELGLRAVVSYENTSPQDITQIESIRSTISRLERIAESLRVNYDILIVDKEQLVKPRYFNVSDDGEVKEVDSSEYCGIIDENDALIQ